jgi:hypothetical protein
MFRLRHWLSAAALGDMWHRATARHPAARAQKLRRTFSPRLEALEPRQLMAVDSILSWNSVLLEANANDHALDHPDEGGPVLTGRAFAIVSVAMYDAYNSVKHVGTPFLLTAPLTGKTNEDAAVAQAAHDTLVAEFPSQQAFFDRSFTSFMRSVGHGPAVNRGLAVGSFVAQQVLASRANDGTAQVMEPGYVPSGLPGFHAADPMNPSQGFYASGAMNVAPFGVPDLADFDARQLDDGTPAGRDAFMQSDEYTAAFDEVKAVGGNDTTTSTQRTKTQTTIGMFWGYDGRPGLGTPPREYNEIVRIIAAERHNSEAQNARLFALVNVAMADAGLAAWDTKYADAMWRPILGIREGDADGNPLTDGDPNWTPLGAQVSNPRPGEINFTPPFPAYTSGHASIGAAMFQTLARFYGTDKIHFSFMSDEFNGHTRGADGKVRPVVVRSFNSLTQAKLENAQSRIYLGIHWAFDRDEGIKQGDNVANYVFDHVLRPSASPLDAHMLASGNEAATFAGIQPTAADAALLMLSDISSGAISRKRG